MRIDPKKLSAMRAEGGLDDARLSRLMGYTNASALRYHLRKIRAGENVEKIVWPIIEAMEVALRRRVAVRELVYASDLPRLAARNISKNGKGKSK